ncbi:MAG: response regulator [Anaerolineales bacterium]|nr:response regulator [Chloroflexota bacterium]MBL6982351.1 response regulator [Anaerolineales bacterium]
MKESGRHIVYVEDDVEMIELVKLILERKGYKVSGASGGQEGWEIIKSELPDLVLLDLMMPDVDGWEVFQMMRDEKTTSEIPVIVITAKAQNIDRVLGLHIAKVEDYITKPFKPEDLVVSVERFLEKQLT